MLHGFKNFLLRGNVVELAVAVVMGAALTALVSAFGDAFLLPLITLVTGGGEAGGSFSINGTEFAYGIFLSQVIVFILTAAAVYFVVVVPFNKARERFVTKSEETVLPDPQLEVLTEIRDLLRERGQANSPNGDDA
ncbi:large conductance mechanosensitive channel protein MscL [Haloglycomyces albus]|uniref:large conductance mechanosensitive channel protein MscL n=1 Tax=Haloglycomyces albus TaxID=526067 RepID=UPI00046D24CB|nr:large conductance mechanosensitive channel protein MscL [Haloglycomyces albus]